MSVSYQVSGEKITQEWVSIRPVNTYCFACFRLTVCEVGAIVSKKPVPACDTCARERGCKGR